MSAAALLSPGAALYMSEDHLLAWFAHAAPGGNWMRYAVGTKPLDAGHPAVRQVAEWVSAGVAEREERADLQGTSFLVRKVPLVTVVADKAMRRGSGSDRDEMLERESAALAVLEAAARHGQSRPSYTVLAKALGLRDRQAARHVLVRLRIAGKIEMIGEGRRKSLRLVASGMVLAPSIEGSASLPPRQLLDST